MIHGPACLVKLPSAGDNRAFTQLARGEQKANISPAHERFHEYTHKTPMTACLDRGYTMNNW